MTEGSTVDASAPVTGQSRMDAAWGSESTDEATVAQTEGENWTSLRASVRPMARSTESTLDAKLGYFSSSCPRYCSKRTPSVGYTDKTRSHFVLISSMTDVALTLLFAVIGEPICTNCGV